MRAFVSIIITFLCSALAFATGEWTVFPSSDNYRRGEILDDKIYLLSGNTLFSTDENNVENKHQYSKLQGLNGTTIFDIIVSEKAKKLIIVYTDGNIDFIDQDGVITNLPDFANKAIIGDRSINGISERDGKLYMMTGFGFVIVDITKAEFEETFYYDISKYKDGTYGNRTTTVSEEQLEELSIANKTKGVGSSYNGVLAFSNGILLAANAEDYRNSLFNESGVISIYDTYEDEWRNIYAKDIRSQFTDNTAWFQGPTSLVFDPKDNQHFFVGTFSLGILEFQGSELIDYYNCYRNEDIESIMPNTYTTRIGGMTIDDDGYLWFVNVGVDNPLRCITPSRKILSYPVKGYASISNAYDRMIQAKNDPYKFKWILGINPWEKCQAAIYYDGGTPEDLSDDENVAFNTLTDQDGNQYSPKHFNDIAEDKNGKIWLLTTSGPFVIDSQIEAYKKPGSVHRVKIPRNDGTNYADYLLAGVDCTCIAIDAADHKWIGTKDDGIYVLSADGLTQLEHFTTDNSPLYSNTILAFAYDETSGTVYISCEGGIVSYVTDAIKGADDYSNVVCYPNPVRPEFTGQLHITGLKDNTKVKICDITNRTVYSTISEGGSISWDLVDESGKRVKAGVYIVYGTDSNGKGGMVSKFVVIN